MKPTIVIGVWSCLATMAGTYGGAYWRSHADPHEAARSEAALETHKLRPITIPIISDGMLKGYISAEFGLVGPKREGHSAKPDPESFFLDEAFRALYSDTALDFSKIQKSDLAALCNRITVNVNRRLGEEAVKETLIKNFVYVPREELQR